MKKTVFSVLAGSAMLALSALPAFAKVERVAGPWDLSGTWVINYHCTSGCSGDYPHTYNLTGDPDTGSFSGTGFYNPNPAVTEDVNGTVVGSDVNYQSVYNNVNPGYTVDATGTIADDGSMSGTATGPGQAFTWESLSGNATRFDGNHGQYVKSQENKQEAAQSRIGMPVQSKGHTK